MKIRFFSKILKIFKIFEKSMEKVIFRWKKSNHDEFQRNVFWWVLGLQMWLRYQKTSILFEHFILKNYITARALPRALWALEYSTCCARAKSCRIYEKYSARNMWNILASTARAVIYFFKMQFLNTIDAFGCFIHICSSKTHRDMFFWNSSKFHSFQ